jgi:hypothetical protein
MVMPSFVRTFALTVFTLTTLSVADQYSDWQRYNSAWHLDYIPTLVEERLDPIVNPGELSGHFHTVIGGSKFGASFSFGEYNSAACTTCPVSADKSNYWMPKLFWINNGGTSYTPIESTHRFYYFLQQNSPVAPVQPFPEGLRILLGDPNSKSPNLKSFGFTCHINPPPYDGDIGSDNFNFERDCPFGFKVTSFFPQCWDGVNLYKSDGSHMAYPAGGSMRVGSCPWSHPIRLPQAMLEFTFVTSGWAPGVPLKGNLAWANGDKTGYGVHADFINA